MIALAELLIGQVPILRRQHVVACLVICVTADVMVQQLSSFEGVLIFLLFVLAISTNTREAQILFSKSRRVAYGHRAIAYVRHGRMRCALCC